MAADLKDIAALIAEAEKLDAAATPGPWRLWDNRGKPTRSWRDRWDAPHEEWTGPKLGPGHYGVTDTARRAVPATFEDAAFIARAREILPRLTAALEGTTEMLASIAALPGVEFDPRQEENIADGVEGLLDHLGEQITELTRERDEETTRADAAVADNAALREALKHYGSDGKYDYLADRALAAPAPGAVLLERLRKLEALEKIALARAVEAFGVVVDEVGSLHHPDDCQNATCYQDSIQAVLSDPTAQAALAWLREERKQAAIEPE